MLTDEQGSAIVLGERVGSPGGEGTTFCVVGRRDLVAKIYHKQQEKEKIEKLRFQRRTPNDKILRIAAWPLNLLTRDKAIVGFLMNRVVGNSIHLLYRPDDRKQLFPAVTWQGLVDVSRNVAAAFECLHQGGVLMGDVNETNVLVTQDGGIRLIDCDSFQLKAGDGTIFPSPVFTAGWTSPELLESPDLLFKRNIEHDLFGLAVMIFHLLFMGKHPFAGRPPEHLLENPPSMEDLIKTGVFPYSTTRRGNFTPPPNFLTLAAVPHPLARMFEQAFLSRKRPTAADWCRELDSIRFKKCQWNHIYHHDLPNCPWCEIWNKGGGNFFIVISNDDGTGSTLREVERLICKITNSNYPTNSATLAGLETINGFRFSTPSLQNLVIPSAQPNPFPSVRKERMGFGAGIGLAIIGIIILAVNPVFIIWPLLLIFGWKLIAPGIGNPEYNNLIDLRMNAPNRIKTQLELILESMKELEDRNHSIVVLEKNKITKVLIEVFETNRVAFNKSRKAYIDDLTLVHDEVKEFPRIKSKLRAAGAEKAQLEEYLRKIRIPSQGIPQIGPARYNILVTNGIFSALDLKRAGSISGLGAGAQELRLWLQSIERRFKPSPSTVLPPSAEQDVRKILRKREEDILSKIQKISSQWSAVQKTTDREFIESTLTERFSGEISRISSVNESNKASYLASKVLFDKMLQTYGQALADQSRCPKKVKKWG